MPATTRPPSIGRSDSTAQRRTPVSGPPATAIAARRDPERRLRRRMQDAARPAGSAGILPYKFRSAVQNRQTAYPRPGRSSSGKSPAPETRNPPTHRTKKNRPPFSRHSGRRRRSSESTKRRGGSDKPSESASPIARPAPRPDALLFHAVLFAHAAFRFADELHQTVAFG